MTQTSALSWKRLQGYVKVLLGQERASAVPILLTRWEGERGGGAARWQASSQHHAYGCYSRTRWDEGSDIVKAVNTCAGPTGL